jgi:hypothetical protein
MDRGRIRVYELIPAYKQLRYKLAYVDRSVGIIVPRGTCPLAAKLSLHEPGPGDSLTRTPETHLPSASRPS